jgi:uncharacterized protein YaaR (DUF327 family)
VDKEELEIMTIDQKDKVKTIDQKLLGLRLALLSLEMKDLTLWLK